MEKADIPDVLREGLFILRKGDFELAEKLYRDVIQVDSSSREAWIGLARSLKGQGRHVAADIAAKKALRRSDYNPETQEMLLTFREKFGTISDDIAVAEDLLKKIEDKEKEERTRHYSVEKSSSQEDCTSTTSKVGSREDLHWNYRSSCT